MGFLRSLFGRDDEPSVPAHQTDRPGGFYVYCHHDADGNVFYIGKGTGDRAWSTHRHPVWQRYVSDRLDGRFGVKILKDGLTEEEALDLEGRLISKHGQDLVNWINPGRQMDYQALETYNAKRKESQRLTELAKETAKDENPEAAVEIAEQALDLVHDYSQIVTETGLVEKLRQPRLGDSTVGDPM